MDYLLTLATDPAVWAALLTLVVMEVVLGIDNLIFISILSNKLPEAQRARTQRLGIGLALVMRLALLGSVAWIASLTEPVFTLFDHAFSWRDMILLSGGGCSSCGRRPPKSITTCRTTATPRAGRPARPA